MGHLFFIREVFMGYTARANRIMELLRQSGTVQVSQISQLLQVSVVTVRKDLQRMEDDGLLHRVHGGAAIRESRISQDPRGRAMEAIAEAVAEQIRDGDCVIMNAGNTTLLTARKLLGRKNITIITNSIAIARELVQQTGIKLIFLGGEVNAEAVFTYGWDAVTQLEQYKANKLILSVSGLSCSAGLTTRHMEAADLLRTMIARTQTVIAVADDTKIGFESFCHVGDLSVMDMLMTNACAASEAQLQQIEAMGIPVHRC